MNIIQNMKDRNTELKAKKVVWAIEENLEKLLKCFYKNKLMNFENVQLTNRYNYLLEKINSLYVSLNEYKDLPEFDFDDTNTRLKEFKETKKAEMEKIAIHENAFIGEKFVACKRCASKGHLESYSHVRSGICFACDGTKVTMSPKFKKHMAKIEKDKDDLPF